LISAHNPFQEIPSVNFKTLITLLVATLSFQAVTFATTLPSSSKTKVIAYNECSSGALRITLNVDNKATKNDLVNGLKTVLDFGGLAISPAPTQTLEIEFIVRAAYCEDSGCQEPYGWNELQWRLKLVKAARVVCDQTPIPAPAAAPEAKKDGGVVVSN
jgi:hypothetical protein